MKGRPTDPEQPYITQLGAILFDSSWAVQAELNVLINLPSGVLVPPIVEQITGINTFRCNRYGVPLLDAMGMFVELKHAAELCVAWNFPFDELLTETAAHRCAMAPIWTGANTCCAMRPLTNIMRMPSTHGFKWPKLTEAYQYCFNEPLICAHDAMADVRGAGRIFNHSIKQGWIKL